MADQRLRQRGWSIQSSDDNTITTRPNQRARAESTATAATEPSLSHDEKVALMNSAFDNVHDDSNDDDDDDDIVIPGIDVPDSHDAGEDSCDNNDDNDHRKKKKRKLSSLESKTSNSQEAMTTPSHHHQQQPPHVELTTFQQEKLDLAKSKLSKWAARLFDPNRIRGLVEPPKTIPLNDEFLTAFGKREKEYDELIGRSADIDKTSLDIIDVNGSDDEEDDDYGDLSSGLRGGGVGNTVNKVNYSAVSTGKVRMTNLSYSTSTEALSQVCELIGPVINVNLILDEYKQSTGRAYVVFEDEHTAQTFVEKMNGQSLDGRTINVSLASASGKKSGGGGGGGGIKTENRYWERDISKKCNHCGQVGHIMNNCPNSNDDYKPCQYCAGFGHQMYTCPMKAICFNCGIPGHVSRECPHRRTQNRRQICTICFANDHHRTRCRERPWNVPTQDAVCMECGEVGHTMCSDMKWFFGLSGVTCFNCGRNDHDGFQCRRPNLEQCSRDSMLAQKEVEMADAINLTDQLSNQRSRSNGSRDRDNSSRAKSAPPSRRRN